ncbi:NAD(P)/FAD-dependent oxidoreductase [Mycobacteroides abscessus]|uniref:Putative oxidoreductase n=1 Tax=Mycobacteroides abscessus TaxID=36809 RepID=A0A0U0ZJJ8_9MYCO|nr:FAD-dependent oxidoreductase [Mycobacteroides abscessus]SKU70758.1 NADH dehydrogenase [Mycobacteroides abscessus subsp. abscessus]MBL3732557.1 FAD-dependent oxidoreductase [Mycobacteroides abscessus subsp. massiliense]MBL3746993.1 FAD-dependent oxidoreductase [Mycobacteroides abscessus subsp. massiliense]MBL3760330.1 FAD-dependent oxidoreductase [Mycobacteroides abscessus subsp. massiliense]MBN7479437.1 FAD-dependent oxidoreductase [Mycobacteroides abscessus subsp. massiliense]
MTDQHPHVVVLGGGYAGTMAANRLQQNTNIDITLVNPREEFVHRLRLHQFAAGTGIATAEYAPMLGKRVRLVVDSAVRIDAPARLIRLESGDILDYDYLIYAIGSTDSTAAGVPGLSEFAYPLSEFESAQRLRVALETSGPDVQITVVGAGLTGIEMASELADLGRHVRLMCGGQLAPTFGAPARRTIAQWFARRRVDVLENTSVTEVRPDSVVLADGTALSSAITVWAGGFGVPALAAHSGLSVDADGRLLTDDTLTSMDDGRIVGAGDAVTTTSLPTRMSCYTANTTGAAAADTVLSRLADTEPAPFRLAYVGQCLSLGRGNAVLQFTRKDDSPVGAHARGRLTAWFKEFVLTGVPWGLRREGRKPGASVWFKSRPRPARAAQHRAEVLQS